MVRERTCSLSETQPASSARVAAPGGFGAAPMEQGALPAGLGLAACLAVACSAFLGVAVVNVAFPSVQSAFPDENLAGLSWVLTAYAVVFAALLVPRGRLAASLLGISLAEHADGQLIIREGAT